MQKLNILGEYWNDLNQYQNQILLPTENTRNIYLSESAPPIKRIVKTAKK